VERGEFIGLAWLVVYSKIHTSADTRRTNILVDVIMPPSPFLKPDYVSGRIMILSMAKAFCTDFISGMILHVHDLLVRVRGECLCDFAWRQAAKRPKASGLIQYL
jgi:hypothetical protein